MLCPCADNMAARLMPAAASPSDNAAPSSMSVSMSASMSVLTRGAKAKCVYERQLLLEIHNKVFSYDKHWLSELRELGLLWRAGPWKPAALPVEPPARRQRKQGERTWKRGGAEKRMLG